MADRKKRLESNVDGQFFVDATCINCDACRQLAPETFQEIGDYSAVMRQPVGETQTRRAYQALLACPVGSIGAERPDSTHMDHAKASFLLHLEGGVYYCGFNSEKSFGANSFFVHHPEGNWLIDSPRYIKHLVEAFEQKGGIRFMFLTHEDDVADADRYAGRFGAECFIHRADAGAVPFARRIIDGTAAQRLAPDFQVVPVPGHTPGSQALLYKERFLFTGDHLWWEPHPGRLNSPETLVWNREQLDRSIGILLDHRFEWVLAGHGDRVRLSVDELHRQLRRLLRRRQGVAAS